MTITINCFQKNCSVITDLICRFVERHRHHLCFKIFFAKKNLSFRLTLFFLVVNYLNKFLNVFSSSFLNLKKKPNYFFEHYLTINWWLENIWLSYMLNAERKKKKKTKKSWQKKKQKLKIAKCIICIYDLKSFFFLRLDNFSEQW